MTSLVHQPELQEQTLRFYGELLCRREDWHGGLALAAFTGAAAAGLAAAASLVGAASLTIDPDVAMVKAHFRDGAFDFVVTTLDEALRVLKNEIRRKRPVAVALLAESSQALKEAAARGLAASCALLKAFDLPAESRCLLAQEGFLLEAQDLAQATPDLAHWLATKSWAPILSDRLPQPSDAIRRQWLRMLPVYQRSATQGARWAWQ